MNDGERGEGIGWWDDWPGVALRHTGSRVETAGGEARGEQ